MDQTNNIMLAMLQSVASLTVMPKVMIKSEAGGSSDFQKLLDQKTQSAKTDAGAEEKPKAEAVSGSQETQPAQEENPLDQVKKLAEQGYAIFQPLVSMVTQDGQTFEPGDYVIAQKGADVHFIPVTGLDAGERQELDGMLTDFWNTVDVSDPKADAMLEATDPTVEHGPAELLEKVVDEQAGQAMQQAADEIQPQKKNDEVEVTDVEQAPQRLFHDVEAAPVKVGEAYEAQQAEEADVPQQIDQQLAQALNRGDSLVRIQLTPENLGSVTVEISQSADGILHVALNAHSGETRGLLERHAADLQGLLSSRTQQEVQVDVQRQQESQQNQNQHPYDGHNGNGQNGQEQRRPRHEHSSQDFVQQLRLGLIPTDGEEI